MDKANLLCAMDRYMLEEFSRRTTQGLKQHTLFRLMLGPLRSFLEVNVQKEVEKDRHVILHAASLVQAEKFPTQQDTQHLLNLARDVDRAFLQQTEGLPLEITIDYRDIDPLRQQRIQILLTESHQLFRQWQSMTRLRNALAMLYDAPQFAKLLFDILHLYSLETKLLSHAVRLPGIIAFARESLTQTLYIVMESVARQLSQELAGRVFRQTT
jgi:hypothetical protein